MAVTFLPRKRQDLHVRLPEMEDLKQEVSRHSCQGCGPSAVTDGEKSPGAGRSGSGSSQQRGPLSEGVKCTEG